MFDIETAARPSRSPAHLSASSQTIMSEPYPTFSAGASEAVSSAAWLPTSASPLLVAGLSAKWVRVFDPRSPASSAAVTSWGTRAVLDLCPNPFEPSQFAAHGDDGVVRVYDLRRPMEHVVAFHEGEAGAVPQRSRTPGMAKPLGQIGWSPTRRGVMTTLERDSAALRVWYLADGPSAKLEGEGQGQNQHEWQNSYHHNADPLKLPVVLADEKGEFLYVCLSLTSFRMLTSYLLLAARSFDHALTSFAFALPSTSTSTSATTHFLGASRDTNPGTSGHRLQIISLRHHQPSAIYEKGLVTVDDHQRAGVKVWPVPAGVGALAGGVDEGEASDGAVLGSPAEVDVDLSARGRTLSLNSVVSMIDRNETPRPGGSVTPRGVPRVRHEDVAVADEEEPVLGMGALNSDMSVLTRSRVERGYGPDVSILLRFQSCLVALMNCILVAGPYQRRSRAKRQPRRVLALGRPSRATAHNLFLPRPRFPLPRSSSPPPRLRRQQRRQPPLRLVLPNRRPHRLAPLPRRRRPPHNQARRGSPRPRRRPHRLRPRCRRPRLGPAGRAPVRGGGVDDGRRAQARTAGVRRGVGRGVDGRVRAVRGEGRGGEGREARVLVRASAGGGGVLDEVQE